MEATTPPRIIQSSVPTLLTELWLQIMENTSIYEAEHLWLSVRPKSRQFRDFVERLFKTYLSQFAISLSLPRRDTSDETRKCWSGAVPNAQIVMCFDGTGLNGRNASFLSSIVLRRGEEGVTAERLKALDILPKARLLEAPAWVYLGKNTMTGRPLPIPKNIE